MSVSWNGSSSVQPDACIFPYIMREVRLLHKIKLNILLGIKKEEKRGGKMEFHGLFQKILLITYETYTVSRKAFTFFSFLLPLQKNSHRPSTFLGFLCSPSATVNLHINRKIFNLTHPNIDKSKSETHTRYSVIIERFLIKSNVNLIIQLMKY